MKLRLPRALFRALVPCLLPVVTLSLASASSLPSSSVILSLPDVEQTDSMMCWAASAANVLAVETGKDASAIYRSLTEAAGNTPGYVETAISWYLEGASEALNPQVCDGRHAVSRSGFASLEEFAASLREAFLTARAASVMLHASGDEAGSVGHAVTVYAWKLEGGRLILSCADSADGVQGMRRVEVEVRGGALMLVGADYALTSLSWLGEDGAVDGVPAAPVGAYMHSSPLLQEYTDMAENRGVYRFGAMPSLITYRHGEPDYTLAVTPDFSPVADMGCYTLVNNGSFQLTVEHNGIMLDATFSARNVGDYAQQYSGVGVRGNTSFVFGWTNPYVSMNEDYKVERVSRLVTDADSVYYNTSPEVLTSLRGETIYRVGAGNSGWYDTAGNINWNAAAWGAGLTAGVTQLAGSYDAGNGVFNVEYSATNYEICTPDNALPSNGQPGDSGSPVFIYNAEEKRFEFVGPLQGASNDFWISRYNPSATTAAIDFCTVNFATSVDFDGTSATTYYISGARVRQGDTLIQDGEAATYLRQGSISLGGLEVARFNGVALDEFAVGTWKKLDADSLTWYTYSDNDFINAKPDVAQGADAFGTEDLFYTSNLHFTADAEDGASTAYRSIELTEHVDLGIGHVQFSLGEGTTSAVYDLGRDSADKFLSSAGFVVDAGVTLNNYFTYEKGRELRRVGEGTMNMVGVGNNDVLLNIGGGGMTFLNRTNGYAAYSALVSNKAVLKLADVGQVYNNVTLGAKGGVLDVNGNDYRWTSGGARAEGADGQTYFGLTIYEGLNRVETSTLANLQAGTTSTITIERTDDFEFAGAFRDGSTYTGTGSVERDSRYTMMPAQLIGLYKQFAASERQDSTSTLRVVYDGGATMEMTGVYTLLTGNSGLRVASGMVSLHGTHTIHAIGSESGQNLNRWSNPNDWHYAMAEMGVTVGRDASFELGDHALLLGHVQVESGGTFIMKQAVNQRYEYVEGWYKAEDTYALSDYYGLKGNVNLASGSGMEVRFDEGVATKLCYGGTISGEGALVVSAGEGSVYLTGQNSFSGEKMVERGNLRAVEGAEGDTSEHKWLVKEQGSLALEAVSSNADVERLVDGASTGVLALTQDFAEQVSLSGLIVGAAEGETVHYGTSDKSLQAIDNQWTLGGGGGTLVVDFLLEGANRLVLGNEYGTGMVVLTHAENSFSGGIELAGHVTLGYTSVGALGQAMISVGYGSALAAMEGAATEAALADGGVEPAGGRVDVASDGMLALSPEAGTADYDFSAYGYLSLAAHGEATLSGRLMVAEGAAYRLGGSGVLTISSDLSGAHGILIDGQGNHGSRVVLATASTATGDVAVQGYDAAKASSGEVTLSFTTDNALQKAASISLQNDAGVDLNGTNQRFLNLRGDASSLLFDEKGGNTLTLDYSEDVALGLRVQAAGTDVVKVGSGTLALSGEQAWKSLSIHEGVVQVADGKSLGYLASGSQSVYVSVLDGATLHVTQDASFLNTLHVAGRGVNGSGYALEVDGHLNNAQGTLEAVADAAVSGQFSFHQVNLQGHDLSVYGGAVFAAASISGGEGGRLILEDGTRMNTLNGSNYTVQLGEGAYVTLDNYKRAESATITTELNGGTLRMSYEADSNAESTYAGNIVVLGAGGTIRNDTWWGERQFHLTGDISGSDADSTLTFSERADYGTRTINASGTINLAGAVALENQVTLSLTGAASIGRLSGDGTLRVDGTTLTLTAAGSDLLGTLELVNGGQLRLGGLASGSSLGTLSTLKLGSDASLHLSSLAGCGSQSLLHIGALSGAGQLLFDASELGALAEGTYRLLTSGSELSGLTTLPAGLAGGRRDFALTSNALAEGGYALDLTISGVAANTTWKGTGTLAAGVANAANITTDLAVEDNTFMAMDSLTITSDEGSHDTLTLGGDIHASAVTYTGAGQVTLVQTDGSSFAADTTIVVDAAGTLNLGNAAVIEGRVELKRGSLSASGSALNAIAGIHVDADATEATLVLTSDDAVTSAINVEGTLIVDSQQSQNGRTLQSNLSGDGSLVKTNSGKLNLVGDHSAFTGSIEVQSGTLQLGEYANGALDTISLNASSINMAEGTALVLKSTTAAHAADITWGNGSILRVEEGSGDGPSPTSVGYTLSGRQTLQGTLNVQSRWGKVLHISGDMVGSGALTFTGENNEGGSPALVLSGNNTYSGGTTVNFSKGTLYAASKGALGTGAIQLQSGTLSWYGVGHGWDGDLTASGIEVSGGVLHTNGYDVTYSGMVRGKEGTLTKSGAGTLKLTGFLYTGQTHITEGTLELDPYYSSLSANVSGEAGSAFKLNSDYTGTISVMGSTGGAMSLLLQGHYDLVGTMGHTGGTELISGSLGVANVNALLSGPLHAHEGTTVSLVMGWEYGIAGESIVDELSFSSGSSLSIGTDSAAGHLSFGSTSGTASFLLDVFSAESYDRLSGVLTPGSLLDVNLRANELGSYLLVAGDNAAFDTSTITLSGKDDSLYSYYWSHTDAGLTLTIDHAAGTVNVWTGGTNGIWSSTSPSWNGGAAFNTEVSNASFRVSEDTTVTLSGFVGSNELVLTADTEAGSTLTLDSASYSLDAKQIVKEGEGTLIIKSGSADYANMNYGGGVLVNAGVLSVDGVSALGTDYISGKGTFELRGGNMSTSADRLTTTGISVAEGTLTMDSTLDSRRISIGSGGELRMGYWDNLNNSSILLKEGGKLAMQSSGCNSNSIEVEDSGIFAIGQTCDSEDNNKVLDINSTISGSGTLTFTNESSKNSAVYEVRANKVIADGSNGALALRTDQGNLHLKAENAYSGGTTIMGGKVTTYTASALGSGSVTLNGGTLTLAFELSMGSLSGKGGMLETGEHGLLINQTKAAIYAGDIVGDSTITKTGAAGLSLTGENLSARTLVVQAGILSVDTITLSQGLEMKQGGVALNIGTLHLAEGATLAYSNAHGNVSIGALQAAGAFTLSLADGLESYLRGSANGAYNILDLGVNLGACANQAVVSGLGLGEGMYTIGFDAATGHSTLQLTDANPWSLSWDKNWGIANAPLSGDHTTLTATGGLAGSAFDDGSRIVVGVKGTEGVVNLYASVDSHSNNAGGTLQRDAWVEVEGGTYGVIAGAHLDNWDSGSRWSLKGDIHLMVSGGSADEVIGLNYKDARGTQAEGNTYVSIGADVEVKDSVIGGGVVRHNGGITLTGNTNVYVYSVLTGDPNAALNGEGIGTRHHAVVGGHAFGSNQPVNLTINGSTHVTVDVSDYEGNDATFGNHVYGGHLSNACSGTISGDTNVTLSANERVSFSGNLAAGSLSTGGSETIKGNTTLTINGGVFGSGGYLTGGSIVSGGTAVMEGTAAVILNAGTINRDVYAAGISNGGTSTVADSRVEIGKDVQLGNVTVSGGFGGGYAGNGSVTGERVLILKDGVDLSSTLASFADFGKIEVAEGTAKLDVGAYAARIDTVTNDGYTSKTWHYEKVGNGTLEIVGTPEVNYARYDIKGGTLKLGEDTALGYTTLSNGSRLTTGRVQLYDGVLDINGTANYHNAHMFDVDSGFITFRGDGDMLVKNSSADASSGLGFNTASSYQAVTYRGTGRAEISANIVNCGQASPSNKIRFEVDSAGKGTDFTELTISGNIGADHSVAERYSFGISKEGVGAMLLSGNNGYGGGTMVSGGTLIAGSDTALGSGYVEVASGATLEIAAGTHVSGLSYGVLFQEGSELKLHSLSTDVAALTTTGANVGGSQPNWSGVNGSAMTLTLADDIQLVSGNAYKVLSLGSNVRSDMNADRVNVCYMGDGRFSFTTRFEASTLYLEATQDTNTALVWNGTASSGIWNQSSQNVNWNRADEPDTESSFMNQDSVRFTAEAANKKVLVAAEGVQVAALEVSGEGYSFSGGAVRTDAAALKESLTMEQGASVKLGEAYTISQNVAERAASIGRVDMGVDGASGSAFIRGQEEGMLSTLDNTVIDIAKGQVLELRDVLLTEHSRVTDDPATVVMENVTLAVGEANAVLEGTSTLYAGTTLVQTGSDVSFSLAEDMQVGSIFSTALDSVTVTGSSLTLDLSGYAASLGDAWQAHKFVAISFGQAPGSNLASFNTTVLSIVATSDGTTYHPVLVKMDEKASATTLYIATSAAAVPEPTTATLSLLALAALAARRRRK